MHLLEKVRKFAISETQKYLSLSKYKSQNYCLDSEVFFCTIPYLKRFKKGREGCINLVNIIQGWNVKIYNKS